MMRRYFLMVTMAATATTSLAQADNETSGASIDTSVVGEIRKQPVFDPFPQVDPRTGEPIADNDEIELPDGKKIKAKDYYAELNEYQSYLNQRGHSLKGAVDPGVVMRVLNNVNKLNEQKQEAEKKQQEHDPKVMEYIDNPDLLYDKMAQAGKTGIRNKLKSLYLNIIKRGDDLPTIAAPEPPARVILEAQESLRSLTYKEWTLSQGDGDKFAVDAKSSLNVEASLKRVRGLADAHAEAKVLSQTLPLVDGFVKGSAALDEPAKAEVKLEFVGSEVFRKSWTGSGIQIIGKKESSPPPISVRRGHKFRFSLGPVPMSGEVGAAGQIGYDWALGVTDKSGALAGMAYCDVSGYAQVGADIEIASVGVGGELVLLRDVLTLEGKMGLEVDPSGAPQIKTEVKGVNKLTVLAGELYAYVRAVVPTLGTPPFDEKQWNWELFKWEGIDTGGEKTLFNFGKVVDANGYSLTGAPSEADYQDVQVDSELAAAFRDAMADLQQEGDSIIGSSERILTTAEALRRDLLAWLEVVGA